MQEALDPVHAMRPGLLQLPGLPPLSLYIHLPWCIRKCPYCDFNSHEWRGEGDASSVQDDYIDALLADLQASLQEAQTELRAQEVAVATHQGEFNALQNAGRVLHQRIDAVGLFLHEQAQGHSLAEARTVAVNVFVPVAAVKSASSSQRRSTSAVCAAGSDETSETS